MHLESLKVWVIVNSFHGMIDNKKIYNGIPLIQLNDAVLNMDRLHSVSALSDTVVTYDMYVNNSADSNKKKLSENAISIIGCEVPIDGTTTKTFPHLTTLTQMQVIRAITCNILFPMNMNWKQPRN